MADDDRKPSESTQPTESRAVPDLEVEEATAESTRGGMQLNANLSSVKKIDALTVKQNFADGSV